MSIWTDAILDQYAADAAQQINQDVPCIFHKFYLATVSGTSVYTLPEKVVSIRRVTYRGRGVEPASWEELTILTPATVVVDPSTPASNIEAVSNRPQWYALHPTNIRDIRFYPAPNETLVTTGDPYSQDVNEARLCITCDATIDTSNSLLDLPDYIKRRTVKSYVLWKCFEKEGKGQDLTAAAYYKKKYDFLISRFRSINDGCFLSKKYAVEDELTVNNQRYPRPMLPSNFERVIY